METWMKISSLLCIFGFLKEFRPSEPYITPYLMSSRLNFTEEQISQDIYPIATYANMLSLIVVFLVTDFLRYKPIIIADAVSGVCVYAGLILFNTLFAVQVVEVMYGLFMAGEVAYYTYIYAKVDTEHFQEVTSHTRSAYLAGRALSGIVSQIIVYFNLFSYYQLQFLTLSGLLAATAWSVLLPSVDKSMYFHQTRDTMQSEADLHSIPGSPTDPCCKDVVRHVWSDMRAAFTSVYVVKWGLWWALSTCCYWQVLYYIQLLWQMIRKDIGDEEPPYYGIVEAAYTLIGAMASLTIGRVKVDWARLGEPVLAVCAVLVAIVLWIMSGTRSMLLAYLTYIFFTVVYHTMITVANSEVAKHINRDSYGLIFGSTTFIALLLQTCLTYIVNKVFRLSPRQQFVVYAGYFAVLGLCFILVSLSRICRSSVGR
ncbi:thiamine transporter 1-like isoform X2 [Macrosteles quadrilineatus]|nr:thiamine transporter 1-like isoform X2 [Macrosteles quadrilineatus]